MNYRQYCLKCLGWMERQEDKLDSKGIYVATSFICPNCDIEEYIDCRGYGERDRATLEGDAEDAHFGFR